MAGKFISDKNIKFLLYEVFDAASLTDYPRYSQHSRKMFDMVIDAAERLAKNLLQPCFEEMDRTPPRLDGEQVRVHPSVKTIMKEMGQGGWIGASFPEHLDGGQLPHLIADACGFIFAAANYSAAVYPLLGAGAARLIESFGSPDLVSTFVSPILEGRWQGTMALTEPQAGSSLADIETVAEPTGNGYYLLRGRKVFISAGDHDGVENVVHLMLAKIPGAPAGARGISLFVVPKKRLGKEGRLAANDIQVSQLFHKMGYRGCPITELSIGDHNDCRGYLVGEPHKGLAYMFQMMNEERLGVGMGAAAIASAAYYAALEYAGARCQGRGLIAKTPENPQIPIIEHADVKRMLLFQRAVAEGSLCLLMQCCRYIDLAGVLDGEEKENLLLLLDILTPVAKTYPSEMGILSTSMSIQCLGGYGYCDDFPVEQHYRDMRIHPIHEGTTGIQGLDLLGRKVMMKNGRAFSLYREKVWETIRVARDLPALAACAGDLEDALDRLERITRHKQALAASGPAGVFLADATLYLECFGIVTIAWQWLRQAVCAQKALSPKGSKKERAFYSGKLTTARYFFLYELPKVLGLEKRLLDDDPLTVEMDAGAFAD